MVCHEAQHDHGVLLVTEDEDFGFTALSKEDVTELDLYERVSVAHRDRMRAVLAMIEPLLNNLKASPEKEYLYWPGRVEKVTDFHKRLVALAFEDVTVE
jgi:hypothetical protein